MALLPRYFINATHHSVSRNLHFTFQEEVRSTSANSEWFPVYTGDLHQRLESGQILSADKAEISLLILLPSEPCFLFPVATRSWLRSVVYSTRAHTHEHTPRLPFAVVTVDLEGNILVRHMCREFPSHFPSASLPPKEKPLG